MAYISCLVDKLPVFENKWEQHVTLMYDVSNNDFGLPEFESGTATIIGYDYLGENKDSLVLLLESEYLTEYHRKLIKLGYKHSFDSILLHTTIQYNVLESTKKFYEIVASTMVGKEIYFHTLTKEDIND